MATAEKTIPPLVPGAKLSRAEFLRRWEAMPQLKFAELIGGVVYMPSPLSRDHGSIDFDVGTWMGVYAAHTPGTAGLANATWFLLEDSPQPDVALRIRPEYGGRSGDQGSYASGPPELVAEVCLSSAAYDLHEKFDLYQKAGVQEYLAVLVQEQEVRWHRLVRGAYQMMKRSRDGLFRSRVFPGLWLNVPALLQGDMLQVLAALQEGLASADHQAFVARLARKKRR
jgi:Uma2 family endonuclease